MRRRRRPSFGIWRDKRQKVLHAELLDELHRISPNDQDHLPREIELIETFRQRHPKLPQFAMVSAAL